MTRYKDRYHQAARDNYLDLLREATRSDSDAADENGMSPVMWAAFYGNLESLRLLISRGGSPNKTDNMGSSSLHFAALNGHMPCVTFLVNFGVNIWILDNDYHSALDLASLRNHQDIVDYLDGVASQQYAMNKRVVTKLREKAALDARKRVKKFNRLVKKAGKKAAKEDKRLQAEVETGSISPSDAADPPKSPTSWSTAASSNVSASTLRQGKASNPNYHLALSPLHSRSQPRQMQQHQHQPEQRQRNGSNSSNSQLTYSEYLTSGRSTRPRSVFGAARRIVGNRRHPDDVDNKSHDVVYVRSDTKSVGSGATSEPDLSGDRGRADGGYADGSAGLFERPGFGSVAFFNQNSMTQTLKSLKERQEQQQQQQQHQQRQQSSKDPASPISVNYNDSIGTSGSLLRRWRDLPWSEEDVENLDDDNDTLAPHTELELFLACLGATEYMSALTAERIDLDALTLCTERDLQDLGVPLGPRKKILDALQRRKDTIGIDRSLQDLRL